MFEICRFGYGVQDPSRVTVFPRSCKGNCDFHTIEFILKDGKECPAVYQSKNPPLDMMVRGQGISYNFMVQNFHFIKAYFTFWGKQNWPKSIKIWWSQKISEAIFCFSFTDFCPLSHWLAAVMPPLGKIQRAYIALYHILLYLSYVLTKDL